MRLEVFHQLGFRHNWNFQSLQADGTGDGVILPPRYLARSAIEALEPRDLQISIFDPQFFLPRTPKGQLSTYDFFPDNIADGFSTDEFGNGNGIDASAAQRSARGCVEFQVKCGFPNIIIPSRYLEGVPGDFIQKQTELFVNPFLDALQKYPDHPPALLQLILNDLMLKDQEYTADILNWVTGLSGVAGVYLIISPTKRAKQLKDMPLLAAALRFIDALARNQMAVVIGYTNTEALLMSIAGPRAVTIGCYENMRMFNIKTFQDAEDAETRGPVPRLYVSRLLQWINYNYIDFIKQELKPGEQFFDENEYQALMFQPTYNWHFSKPELYKHALVEIWRQLRFVGDADGKARYERVAQLLQTARSWYQRFDEAGIAFDADSDGSHLPMWLTVANQFAAQKGWR